VYNGKPYYRWSVLIPSETIDELDWKEGIELESVVKDGKLTLKKKSV
jgi:bifunctional DNA-binding transcriptional regulator/antitoxin component of YhaV-PrlF toxin-antitoxin module